MRNESQVIAQGTEERKRKRFHLKQPCSLIASFSTIHQSSSSFWSNKVALFPRKLLAFRENDEQIWARNKKLSSKEAIFEKKRRNQEKLKGKTRKKEWKNLAKTSIVIRTVKMLFVIVGCMQCKTYQLE